MSFFLDRPLRRLLTEDGPIRRFILGEPQYQMMPMPPGVDPTDYLVQVATTPGYWATNAAEGWARKLGLTGTPQGEELGKRMAIAYAAGGLGITDPNVISNAQRKLGLIPGPTPIPPPTAPRRRRVVAAPVEVPPAVVPVVSETEIQKINSVFDETIARGMSPKIPKEQLVIEARGKGVREPERVVQAMIDAGLLEQRGRFVMRPIPSR